MVQLCANQLTNAAPLFAGWDETMIWSCLGGCMGTVWADNAAAPRSALAALGDFGYLAGEPDAALATQLAPFSPEGALLVPQNERWAACIEREYAGRFERLTRYAFCKDANAFDEAALRRFAEALPPGYELRPIDEVVYNAAVNEMHSRSTLEEPCLRDLCGQFPTWDAFAAHGLGFAALCGGVLAAGASTYSWYNGGIELEVDTAAAHRRKGLARACSARLILECLSRSLFPSWDAANPDSAALARQLGYLPAGEYPAYYVWSQIS